MILLHWFKAVLFGRRAVVLLLRGAVVLLLYFDVVWFGCGFVVLML